MGYVIPAPFELLIHAEIAGVFLSLHTGASAGPSAISMPYPEFDPDGYRETCKHFVKYVASSGCMFQFYETQCAVTYLVNFSSKGRHLDKP